MQNNLKTSKIPVFLLTRQMLNKNDYLTIKLVFNVMYYFAHNATNTIYIIPAKSLFTNSFWKLLSADWYFLRFESIVIIDSWNLIRLLVTFIFRENVDKMHWQLHIMLNAYIAINPSRHATSLFRWP